MQILLANAKIMFERADRKFTFICAILITIGASAQTKKAIVAYFSATGTTEAVAKQLAKEVNNNWCQIVYKRLNFCS